MSDRTPSRTPSNASVHQINRPYYVGGPYEAQSRSGSFDSSSEPKGLSPGTKTLARRALEDLHANPENDKTELFFSGLQWLLDQTINVKPFQPAQLQRIPSANMLTQRAVNDHNEDYERRPSNDHGERSDRRVEEKRTSAWISKQQSTTTAQLEV